MTDKAKDELHDRLPDFIPASGVVWLPDEDGDGAFPVIGWVLSHDWMYDPVTVFGVHSDEYDFYDTREEAAEVGARKHQKLLMDKADAERRQKAEDAVVVAAGGRNGS